jgi:hypothetical protein
MSTEEAQLKDDLRKKPYEIEITSSSWAFGDHAPQGEEEIETVHVHIRAKEPLDAIVLGHVVADTMKRDLGKEPKVKILP